MVANKSFECRKVLDLGKSIGMHLVSMYYCTLVHVLFCMYVYSYMLLTHVCLFLWGGFDFLHFGY